MTQHSTSEGDALEFGAIKARVESGLRLYHDEARFLIAEIERLRAARGAPVEDETSRLRVALGAHHEPIALDGWCLTCGQQVLATPSSEPQEEERGEESEA